MNNDSKTILVVDDDTTNRVLLRALLKRAGYVVDEAESGVACLQYLTSRIPAAILLDIMMPELDGLAVCRRIRENFSREELPVIMVTTFAENERLAEAIDAGANDFVSKPIDRVILLARLENQLLLRASRMQIAEQQRALAESLVLQNAIGDVLPDALAVHDMDSKLVHVNQPFLSSYKMGIPATIQEVFAGLFDGAIATGCQRGWEKVKGSPELSLNYELTVPTGPVSHVQVVSRPVSIGAGMVYRVWLWRDLSAQRELEKRANQRVRLETVGIFASGVAHNFNNFLGSIMGATDLIARAVPENEKMAKCVAIIRKAVTSGSRLTKRISRLGMRKGAKALPQGATVRKVVEELVAESYPEQGRNFELILQNLDGLPTINMTEEALREVIGNVLSNSYDALDKQRIIRIESRPSGDSSLAELQIVDTGVGMDEQSLQRVFEPFYTTKNLDVVNGVSIEGDGLGLWNTYHILKVAGGDIQLTSVPGMGTTVTLRLPVSPSTAEPAAV
jgi:signal transduction histidine kinase/FixJ family two-component response regulator